MSKMIITEKKVNGDCLVKYYLLENDKSLYGIEVEFFDSDMHLKTSERVEKISQSKNLVLKMIEILAQKDVTPVSFLHVVDEIFDMLQN